MENENTLEVNEYQLQKDIEASEAQTKYEADQAAALKAQQEAEAAKASEPQQKDVGQELTAAIGGGFAQIGSDIVTLPERAIDMFSGEMEEKGEDYTPDWDPFQANHDRFQTTTWWGGLIKGVINVGGLFIGAGKITGGIRALSGASKASQIIRGGVTGGLVDLTMQSSQDDNMLGAVEKQLVAHNPNLAGVLGPLATRDTDHPAMKTLKNVVEGLGVGGILDALFIKSGAFNHMKAGTRNTDALAQTKQMAKGVPDEVPFHPYRDVATANRTQGTTISKTNVSDVTKDLDTIDTKWDADAGSTAGPLTRLQAARAANVAGESPKVMQEVAQEFAASDMYQSAVKRLEGTYPKIKDVSPQAAIRLDNWLKGRNAAEISIVDLIDEAPKDIIRDIPVLRTEDALALDLVVGGLTKQSRDLATAAREVSEFTDIMEEGGIGELIKDNITIALTEAKRTRYMAGANLKSLDTGELKAAIKELESTTQDQVNNWVRMVKEDPTNQLSDAYLEAISRSNDIRNLEDFDAFMRHQLRGTEFGGKKATGLVVKELGGVMVHSILSGPKTPVRAAMGTASAATFRALSQALGATLRAPFTGDVATAKASLAAVGGMVESVPEAFKLFRNNFRSYWTGEMATGATRFSEYTKADLEWDNLRAWAESSGNDYDKAAFNIANMSRSLNNNSLLTYSTKLMAATDDAWRVILARGRAREKAMRAALDQRSMGVKVDGDSMKVLQDKFYNDLLDADGNIDLESDLFLKSTVQEATLTTELDGFAKGLETLFNKSPWTKPFFLFARTGVNGIAMTTKYTPMLNLMLDKQRAILAASADNLQPVSKYGITNAADLANEKALILGRQVIGTSVVFMAGQAYMSGRLRGNGPSDRSKRNVWKDAGWRANEIKIGDTWVSTKQFEPFNQILDLIADIGDHQAQMGPEWAEQNLLSVANIIAGTVASKSYLEGLSQLVDLTNGEAYQAQKIIGNLINNQVPLAGLRNELGKLITPYNRELSASIFDAVRNRNLGSEQLAGEALPIKYDILTGEPIRDDDFMTRMFNSVSPVQFNFDDSPGRDLLFASNYDMRLSVMSAPGNISLRDSPQVRSLYQRAIGKTGLGKKLDRLAERQDVKDSVARMNQDLEQGKKEIDPTAAYVHNRLIRNLFSSARREAWASIQDDPKVKELVTESTRLKTQNLQTLNQTTAPPRDDLTPILQMYK
jgi:hypothetical protein